MIYTVILKSVKEVGEDEDKKNKILLETSNGEFILNYTINKVDFRLGQIITISKPFIYSILQSLIQREIDICIDEKEKVFYFQHKERKIKSDYKNKFFTIRKIEKSEYLKLLI